MSEEYRHNHPEENFRELNNLSFEEFLAYIFQRMEEASAQAELESGKIFSEAEKEALFACIEKLGDYVQREKIKNIIFADSSARVVYSGLKEYLNLKYDDNGQTGMYFVNPDGVDPKNFNETPMAEGLSIRERLFLGTSGKKELIDEEFAAIFTSLQDQKDKPILIFDTCIHSGNTLDVIGNSLWRQGFSDVRTGVFNEISNKSKIKPNLVLFTEEEVRQSPLAQCYPFGYKVDMVERGDNGIVSKKTENERKLQKGKAFRLAFRNLVREKLKSGEEELPEDIEKGEF